MPDQPIRPLGFVLLAAALALPSLGRGQTPTSDTDQPLFEQVNEPKKAAPVTGASPRSAASGSAEGPAPKVSIIKLDFLTQQEAQASGKRINASVYRVFLTMPFAADWSVQAGYTKDIISGASPRYWTKGSASVRDVRNAQDIAVTRYFPRNTLSIGASLSEENDCRSQGISFSGTQSSEDKNTTLSFSLTGAHDDIHPLGLTKHKHRLDYSIGITKKLSSRDQIQVGLTEGRGVGFFSIPFKWRDTRPPDLRQNSVNGLWTHDIGFAASLKLSYRYYTDSWSVKAHTFGAEYVQPLGDGWVLTPNLRLHDQSAARFYVDQADFPGTGKYVSFDQRLSAFGAHIYGLKISKAFEQNWTVDLKYERYMQRTNWRLFGNGSPDMDPLRAHIFQIGLTRIF